MRGNLTMTRRDDLNPPDWNQPDDPYAGYLCPLCEGEDIHYDPSDTCLRGMDFYYCRSCGKSSPAEDLVEGR